MQSIRRATVCAASTSRWTACARRSCLPGNLFGEGLTWEESIPAQAAAIAGLQSANIAVHGYATDQIYLRLARELPRFQRPVAVIAIFMTELFGRNLDHDRPHLAPGLVWRPPQQTSRLAALATLIVPYRRDATVDAGVALTREALLAMVHLAQSRGATPLVVIPQFGLEDAAQRALRQRIVTDGVPSVLVPLDPGWRLPGIVTRTRERRMQSLRPLPHGCAERNLESFTIRVCGAIRIPLSPGRRRAGSPNAQPDLRIGIAESAGHPAARVPVTSYVF